LKVHPKKHPLRALGKSILYIENKSRVS